MQWSPFWKLRGQVKLVQRNTSTDRPCSFLRWNRGEPRKLFLMEWRRALQATELTDGEPGGVAVRVSGTVATRWAIGRAGPSWGLLAGETALADIEPCKLFLRRLTHTDRHTYIQTQTDRERDRERAGLSWGLLAGETALADIEPCKLFLRRLTHTDRHAHIQTETFTNRQTDRQRETCWGLLAE